MKSVRLLTAFAITVALAFSAIAAPSADSIMKEAQSKAAAEGKNIFLVFSTTGCVWCKVLKSFIESDEVKPIFTKYFIPVQLMLGNDANTNPGATIYEQKYGPAHGVPFHLFLTADGKQIIDSNEGGSGGNIGYPAAPHEIAWFMTMLKKAAPKMSESESGLIEEKLKSYRKG